MAKRLVKITASKTDIFMARLRIREDRERARRIAKIRKGLVAAKLYDGEIEQIEQIVFLAYGRTKL